MSALVIDNLSKSFNGHPVLSQISMQAEAGQLVVVLGPSGCGKSTLLRLIAGLESPEEGRISLDGVDITLLEPQKRRTAMVFQNYALYPHMTVFDNMAFPLKVARTPKSQIKEIVQKTAQLLELESMLDRRPAQLSGGQRQRVALGRGLVRKPSIFLLDEPLSNLDAALRIKMRQEIVALQKKLGITMLYVTHDQTEALTMAGTMVVLKDGVIRQRGAPGELYENPMDSFVASFLGAPSINLYEDDITTDRGRSLPFEFSANVAHGRYLVGIRPEHIHIDPNGPVAGTILSSEYIGPVRHLRVQAGEIALTVTVDSAGYQFNNGTPVRLFVDPAKILLFDLNSKKRVV